MTKSLRRMMRRPLAAALIAVAVTLFAARGWIVGVAAQQGSAVPEAHVENVRVVQSSSAVIQVTYDLTSSEQNAVFSVSVEVSVDGGQTWDVKVRAVSGDVGANVRPGMGKSILWEAGKDVETVQGDRVRFRITPVATRTSANTAMPAAAPRRTSPGSVSLVTNPPGATVRIDGRVKGVTPVTVEDLSPGAHQVVLSRAGYLDNITNVTVVEEMIQTVSRELTAAPPTRPKAGMPKWVIPVAGGGAIAALLGAKAGAGSGPSCSFTTVDLTAASAQGATPAAWTVQTPVTVSPVGCSNPSWTASSSESFLTVTPTSGTGDGVVTLSETANPSDLPRSATVTIAGRSSTIVQQGRNCPINGTGCR